ncbi:MAG: serine hydrolase [Bacteroidia bacterium]|nr:serine hydrolase [Bacteroidia bacterium]
MLIIIGGAVYLSTLLPIITGYSAKHMGSWVFISGRAPAEVDSTDLNFSFIKYTKDKVDFTDSSVTSSFLWGRSKSIYRDKFGVTLVRKTKENKIREVKFPSIPPPGYCKDTISWPIGDLFPDTLTGINLEKLSSISKKLISENGYGGNAFAFMVLHKGIPVAEAYKPQFNKETRFLSWSIAKSFVNGMVGVLVKEGALDINKPTGLDEWQNDDRRNITWNDLMRMQSGLEWNEDYGNRSDVTVMLHCTNNMAEYAYNKPMKYPIGTNFLYSSGTVNIISYLIRKHFNDDNAYYAFPYEHLFYKIGITDAVIETDPSGTYVGSSYMYATARDYARFALLYQQDGVFNGERLLPEGWVKYSREPGNASNGAYGSLFYLSDHEDVPSAPKGIYMCVGHDGKRIYIMPDQELIVVVLGYSKIGTMNFDGLLKDILGTL